MIKKFEQYITEQKANDIFIYHGTSKGAALNIQRYGFMKPSNTGDEYPSISFTNDLRYAEYYAKAKGGSSKMVILRTKLNDKYKISNKIKNNKGAEYVSFTEIPVSELEVLSNDKTWKPLNNWNVIFDEPLTEGMKLIRGEGKSKSGEVELFGKGLYLTDDIDVAKFYGDTIKEFDIEGKIYDTTKNFTSTELRKFLFYLDEIFKTNVGKEYLQDVIDYNDGKLPKDTDVDYVGVSWALNSKPEFYEILKKNNLDTNKFNSYANDCTAMNMVLQKMGYVGLKYSTTEIDDLDDIGLGNKNSYVIFDKNAIKLV